METLAGPATTLAKTLAGQRIHLTAVDVLPLSTNVMGHAAGRPEPHGETGHRLSGTRRRGEAVGPTVMRQPLRTPGKRRRSGARQGAGWPAGTAPSIMEV